MLASALQQGLQALGLSLTPAQQQQLLAYLALFQQWNQAYNLSAIRQPQDMLHLHLLDSLSIAPHLQGQRFIDVGTGGGLPGIPLAICFPQRHFTLLDSAGKKMRFLFQVKQQLQLDNVALHNGRVEAFTANPLYDGVISRAFASLQDMVHHCAHLLQPQGLFYAMKGQWPQPELNALAPPFALAGHHRLQVPGVDAERCLILLHAQHET